ncbi:hypothetical protein MMC16_001081 [Acarospora aff. strigata]|nr:hypothetical protein [Acarospora aff. strigata]
MACHFYDLSAELRNMIYRLALVDNGPIDLWSASEDVAQGDETDAQNTTWASGGGSLRDHSGAAIEVANAIQSMRRRLAVNLLRTCKSINDEATSVLYSENEFRFTMEDGWIPLHCFLTTIGRRNRRHIKALSVFVPVHCLFYLHQSLMAATPLLSEVAELANMTISSEHELMGACEATAKCCKLWIEEKTLRRLFLTTPPGMHLHRNAFEVGLFDEFEPLMEAQEELSLDISMVIHQKAKIGDNDKDYKRALIGIEEDLGLRTLVEFAGDHRYQVALFEES